MSGALQRHWPKLVILIVIAALLLVLPQISIAEYLDRLVTWTAENPARGALLYLVAAAFAGLAMTPGWVPMMLAGLMFGLERGIPIGAIGITLAALTGFVAGRTLLREWIEQRIAGNRRLVAIDRALDQRAFTIVLLTRLALLIPFNLLNYMYGLTRVRFRTYGAATLVGMLPAVVMYVYLGTLARDIGQLLDGDAVPADGRWWIAAIALVAIVAATAVIHRAATRALEETLDDDAGPDDTTQSSHDDTTPGRTASD